MAPGPISSTTRLPPWQLAPHWQQASSNRQQQTVAAHSDGSGAATATAAVLGVPGPTGNKSNGFPQSVLGVFFSREGCGGPLLLLPGRASYLCAGGPGKKSSGASRGALLARSTRGIPGLPDIVESKGGPRTGQPGISGPSCLGGRRGGVAPRLHELIVERDRFQGVVAWVAQELHVVLGREVATLESDSAQLGFEIFPAGFAELAALLRQLFPQVAPVPVGVFLGPGRFILHPAFDDLDLFGVQTEGDADLFVGLSSPE